MARLPFEQIDLLVVDEMGKDVSGSGMDSNIIGRHGTLLRAAVPEPEGHLHRGVRPDAAHLRERDRDRERGLHDPPAGQQDRLGTPTYIELSHGVLAGRVPSCRRCWRPARDAIAVALSCLGLERVEDARVVRIKNTLRLAEVDVSETLLAEVAKRDDLTQVSEPAPLAFDAAGALRRSKGGVRP